MKNTQRLFSLCLALLCLQGLMLAQDGTLDPTFNARNLSGKFTYLSLGPLGVDAARLSDGKLAVAVEAVGGLSVMRVNANGTVDSAFGASGNGIATLSSGTSSFARAITVQPDGKIVVAGQANPFGSNDFAIARFNANGTSDTSFSSDGIAVFGIGSGTEDIAYGLAIQPDGKIVVVGTTSANGTDWAMIRLNADGTLDGSFTNGQITRSTGNDGLYSVALQADGKIVAAGYEFQSSEQRTALARFTSSGIRDSTFNGNGVKIDDFGTGTQNFNSVKIQADGKIAAAGALSSGSAATALVGRYNADGTNDNTFDADGRVGINNISTRQAFTKLAIQTDGKLVCAGYAGATLPKDDFLIVRLQSNGAIDTTFGANGRALTDFNGQTDQARGLALEASGKITIAGVASDFLGFGQIGVAQFNANGTLDNTYAARVEGSPNLLDLGLGNDEIRDLAFQSDGKIIAAGVIFNGNQDWGIARYNSNGALDSTFGANGTTSLSLVSGANEVATSVSIQSDNKIVVAGYTASGGTNRIAVARFNANGTIDNTFAGGQGFLISSQANSEAYDALALPNGKIMVAGWINDAADDFEVFQYNSDGTADINFGSGGQVSIDFGGASGEVAYALARQPDGKILVGGTNNVFGGGSFSIARLNANGTLDNTFDGDGKRTIDIVSANTNNDFLRAIIVQNDTKILLGGTAASTSNGTNNNFALARLLNNGAIDSTFGANGQTVTDFNGREDGLFDLELLNDGKILAVGFVIAPGGTTNAARNLGIARYLPNGTLDNGFSGDGKVELDAGGFGREDLGYSALVQPSGRLLVGGYSNRNTFDLALTGVRNSIPPAPFGYLPTSVANAQTNVTGNSATLNGTINTNATVLTDAKFAYGLNPNNLTDTTAIAQSNLIGTEFGATAVSANLTGLAQASRYFYRLVARNSIGASQSEVRSFYTLLANPEITTAGLQLWLRGDLYIDTVAGAKVASWRNAANPAVEARQTNDAARPLFVANGRNGKPVVSFSGGATNLIADSIRLGAFTVFAVFNSTETSAFRYVWEHGSTTANNIRLATSSTTGSTSTATLLVTRAPNATTYKYLTPNWANDAQYRIVTSQFNGQFVNLAAGLSLYVNGELQNAQGNSGGSTTVVEIPETMYIPARLTGNFLRGNIAELIAYNRLVTNAERDSVQRYLSQKYNIPLSTVSTKDGETDLPKSFALAQNYPNPFNPTTAIGYALPQASNVSLKIYDVLGREVATLVNGRQAAGNYAANFNAARLASGVYFYRLEANAATGASGQGFVETKKMMLVK